MINLIITLPRFAERKNPAANAEIAVRNLGLEYTLEEVAVRASHTPAPGVAATVAPFRAWRSSRLAVAREPTRTTIDCARRTPDLPMLTGNPWQAERSNEHGVRSRGWNRPAFVAVRSASGC